MDLHVCNSVVLNDLGNILPESQAAPGIVANQKSLEKHMRADSLEQKLQRRPTAEQLQKEGILEENEEAAA